MLVDGLDSSEIATSMHMDGQPAWMSDGAWVDCAGLELAMPCFKGLRHSLRRHAEEWHEYFKVREADIMTAEALVANATMASAVIILTGVHDVMLLGKLLKMHVERGECPLS